MLLSSLNIQLLHSQFYTKNSFNYTITKAYATHFNCIDFIPYHIYYKQFSCHHYVIFVLLVHVLQHLCMYTPHSSHNLVNIFFNTHIILNSVSYTSYHIFLHHIHACIIHSSHLIVHFYCPK